MVTHLTTTTFTPQWCQNDTEACPEEQSRRLSIFRVKILQEVEQDCTYIAEFCGTWRTKQLYLAFAPTWDAFCVEVLRVEPQWVDRMCAGLSLLRACGTQGPVSASEAVDAWAMVAEVPALEQHGGDRTSEAYQGNDNNLAQRGTSSRYHIARLKRDHPAIAEALARGAYPSVRAAAKAAGLVHEPTPLECLHRHWRKASPEERALFWESITHDAAASA